MPECCDCFLTGKCASRRKLKTAGEESAAKNLAFITVLAAAHQGEVTGGPLHVSVMRCIKADGVFSPFGQRINVP